MELLGDIARKEILDIVIINGYIRFDLLEYLELEKKGEKKRR